MAEDLECEDDEDEPAIIVLSDKSYDKFTQKTLNSHIDANSKTSTFICKEATLQKPYNQRSIKLNAVSSKPTGKENNNKTSMVS
jgi:hypothetical protein